MGGKSVNRRTLKTRMALCEALAELLTEKELQKVTVQEIADKADMNRVTFYNHYLDVYDLYEKIEDKTIVDLGMLALQLQELPAEEFFTKLVGYIADNRAVFRMIFSPHGPGQLRDRLSKMIEGIFRQVESEKTGSHITSKDIAYMSCYRAQGCLAVLSKWVLEQFAEPQEFIVKMISQLDSNIETLFSETERK